MTDNQQEPFPIVDEKGNVIGSITRGEAHSGSKILHPVVHLHVFNSQGELYLQKRPEWKYIQPGKWEEIGITDYIAQPLGQYVFESQCEKEFVYVYSTIFPNAEKLATGRFWTCKEIETNIGKQVFTPNFEVEYLKYFNKETKY